MLINKIPGLLIIMCLPYLQAKAQLSVKPEIGLNISNYNIKQEYSKELTKAKGSPIIGVAADYRFSPAVAIEAGAQYEQNGYKSQNYLNSEDVTINCIELPASLLYTPQTRTKSLTLGFGGYYTYHLNGNLNFNGENIPLKFGSSANSSQYLISKKADYGWRLEGILKLTDRIYAKGHLQMSVENLFYESNTPDSPFDVKNYNYGITLGYTIPITRKAGLK